MKRGLLLLPPYMHIDPSSALSDDLCPSRDNKWNIGYIIHPPPFTNEGTEVQKPQVKVFFMHSWN
jgi:hypothetical protein